MPDYDPRLTPTRGDIAARSLEGLVAADRYVDGRRMQVRADVLALRRDGAPSAMRETELLRGETFTVYDETGGFAWGQSDGDGYVGWVARDGLSPEIAATTHRVAVLRTIVFSQANLKSEPVEALSHGAKVAALGEEGRWTSIGHGWIYTAHLASQEARAVDWVAEAERFIGAPYLWGGRSALGLDCSALIQLSLAAAGVAAPRDTDMQEKALGALLAPDAPLRRGDIVFWKGHVGVMQDAGTLLHANAFHMATAAEPLAAAVARITPLSGPPTSYRRLA